MILGAMKLLMRDIPLGMENDPPLPLRLRYAALAARAFFVCLSLRRGMFYILKRFLDQEHHIAIPVKLAPPCGEVELLFVARPEHTVG